MPRKKAIAKLTWEADAYNPSALRQRDEKELRKEYSRLRSIARKRLERIEGTEWETSETYRKNKGKYIPVKEIASKGELIRRLNAAARFVSAEAGSLSGLERIRDRSIATLHSHGYTFIGKKDFRAFGEFMEFARSIASDKMYGSARLVEMYRQAMQHGVDPETVKANFDFFYDNVYNDTTWEQYRNDNNIGSDAYQNAFSEFFGAASSEGAIKRRR